MRVGIVGGGITGLALTHALARAGVDSTLFEREAEPGGVIRTRAVDGHLLELGPQRTRLSPPVHRLVDELDLGERVVRAAPGARLFIWRDGRLRALPGRPLALLRSDLLSRRGRLRLLAEPATGPPRPGESVARYFTRKAGGEAYRVLFGPLISATFASDPAEMPVRHSLPMILGPLGVRRSLLAAARRLRRRGAAEPCTFVRGMRELPAALAARHRTRIRLGDPVRRVSGEARGLVLESEAGVEERVDHVVLTTPAGVTADLLRDASPAGARILDSLRYNQVAVVQLAVPGVPEGFGFQVAFGERLRTRGVTWSASLFGRTGTSTAYLGGGMDPEVRSWSDERVGAVAAAEFEEVHGVPASVLAVERTGLPAYDATWDAMDELELPPGITIAANYRARLGIGGRIAEAEAVAERLARRGAGSAEAG